MKKSIILSIMFFAIFFVSCKDDQPIIPNKITIIDTLQDMQRLDSVFVRIGFLYQKEVVITTESEYRDLEQKAIKGNYMRNSSFPNIDFSKRTVIGLGDQGNDLADLCGGITVPQFIAIRNDSSKRYTFISRFIYPDCQPRAQSGYWDITHLYSIPKILPDYDIVFLRDTI